MPDAPEILTLEEAEVRRLFTPEVALASQRRAFAALADGSAVLPERLLVPGTGDDVSFCYAARLAPDACAVSKFGSVHPGNTALGLPAVSAVVTVLDAGTGRPRAVMDGTVVTTLRTAAASAVALDVLAPARTKRLALFGTGVQAIAHVDALLAVREFDEILVVGRTPERASEGLDGVCAAAGERAQVRAASPEQAVSACDVVALCTTSAAPVLEEEWVRPGTTIVGVGSFTPRHCEFPAALLTRARLVVDDPETAATDAGPVAAALADSTLMRENLVGLGDVLTGRSPGRTADDEIVVYTSVGLGVQDAAAAEAIVAAYEGSASGA